MTEEGSILTPDDFIPYPWNPRFLRKRNTIIESAVTVQGETSAESSSTISDSGACSPTLGFYRVVRKGLSPYGWTTNQLLNGIATIVLELGNVATPADFSFYAGATNNGGQLDPIPGFDILAPTNGTLRAIWNTALATNGVYHLVFGAKFGNGNILTVEGRAFTVTVSNQICFPDSYNWAGYFLEIQAQSVHANASAHVDIYDESGFGFVFLDTVTDSEGFVTYGGIRGFRVANYDLNGLQYPDDVYTVVVSTTAEGSGDAGAGASTATGTNFLWAERAWPSTPPHFDTQFSIAYMPVFGDPSYGNGSAVTLQTLIQDIYVEAQYRNHFDVVRGHDQNPFELNRETDWLLLLQDLYQDDVRNFYYFGHGGPGLIGRSDLAAIPPVLTFLNTLNITSALNNTPSITSRPRHPYRFVFLDGCDTAIGGMCQTFGIPKKKNMTAADFTKKGLRLRAFMGWDNAEFIALAGAISQPHVRFLGDFFDDWFYPDDEGNDTTLRQAINAAKGGWGEVDNHLIVYGYDRLSFYDTLP